MNFPMLPVTIRPPGAPRFRPRKPRAPRPETVHEEAMRTGLSRATVKRRRRAKRGVPA